MTEQQPRPRLTPAERAEREADIDNDIAQAGNYSRTATAILEGLPAKRDYLRRAETVEEPTA